MSADTSLSRCGSSGIAGCILIASSGGVALISLLVDEIIVPVIYTILLMSLGLTLYKLSELEHALITMISTSIMTLLSIFYPKHLIISISIFYLTLVYLVYATSSIEVSLSYWPTILLPTFMYGGSDWVPLYASSVVVFSVLLSYLEGRRGHSFMILTIAPLTAVVEPLLAASVSASALALSVVLANIVERSGCPFTQDSGLVFIGLGISLIGVLVALFGGVWRDYWFILWLVGFLFIEAGALVPQEPDHSSSF